MSHKLLAGRRDGTSAPRRGAGQGVNSSRLLCYSWTFGGSSWYSVSRAEGLLIAANAHTHTHIKLRGARNKLGCGVILKLTEDLGDV